MKSFYPIKNLTILIFLLIQLSGTCCMNEYRALVNGEMMYAEAGNVAVRKDKNLNNKSYWFNQLKQAKKRFEQTNKVEDYSDLGVMYVYTGNYQKAKKIFIEIEQKKPGLYRTAANLGTTYELLGQNDSALVWIKRAISIYPISHGGSEWIHVKVLEAKLKAKGNEAFLHGFNVLDLDFGSSEIPTNIKKLDLKKLKKHLRIQLAERMSFIEPKDPIIAQLLFDLGNVSAIDDDATSGLQIFRQAKKYGYSTAVFESRMNYFEKLQRKVEFRTKAEEWVKDHLILSLILCGISLIFVLVIIRFVYKKLKKRINKNKTTNDSSQRSINDRGSRQTSND